MMTGTRRIRGGRVNSTRLSKLHLRTVSSPSRFRTNPFRETTQKYKVSWLNTAHCSLATYGNLAVFVASTFDATAEYHSPSKFPGRIKANHI